MTRLGVGGCLAAEPSSNRQCKVSTASCEVAVYVDAVERSKSRAFVARLARPVCIFVKEDVPVWGLVSLNGSYLVTAIVNCL